MPGLVHNGKPVWKKDTGDEFYIYYTPGGHWAIRPDYRNASSPYAVRSIRKGLNFLPVGGWAWLHGGDSPVLDDIWKPEPALQVKRMNMPETLNLTTMQESGPPNELVAHLLGVYTMLPGVIVNRKPVWMLQSENREQYYLSFHDYVWVIGLHYFEKEGILVSYEDEKGGRYTGDEGFPTGAKKRWFHTLEGTKQTDYDLRMIGENPLSLCFCFTRALSGSHVPLSIIPFGPNYWQLFCS